MWRRAPGGRARRQGDAGSTDNGGDGGAGATGGGELYPTVERGRWREGGRGGKERKREREGWMDGGMEGGTGLQNVEPHYALGNSLWAAPCQPRPIP